MTLATASRDVERVDRRIVGWLQLHSITALRIAIGVVFLWFGFLKFFPGLSPAESLVADTTARLTFGLLSDRLNLWILATWECAIGLGLLIGRWRRVIVLLLWIQMVGTFLPLIFYPGETFSKPFVPTLEGQYIIKNIVIVTGAMVVGATVRGRQPRPSKAIERREAVGPARHARRRSAPDGGPKITR